MSPEHLQWLPDTYFPVVMGVNRYPRYKNSRSADIYVKGFLDENEIPECPEWGLPEPNQEAAYKSLAKYAKDIPAMEENQVRGMNLAWEWTAQHFGPYMGNARIKTVEEVVNDLDKTTSSGYPFNNLYPKKKELFEEYPEIIGFLEDDWTRLKETEYSACFTNSLKEEIRPAVKTAQNKIRTFTAGAVDITVHGNRLFSDMNEKMNAAYLRSSSGVGMSPLNGNWEKLYQKLKIFKNGYALDESEYDSSLRAYMMWGCARLRWQMLREEDRTPDNLKRLKVYYRNLVNSLIITPEGVIIMKLGGNPSGSVNTINDNTLILYTLLAYAWIMNCGEDPSYTEFEMNTSKILVGDDNTWTVSDWAHQFFNAKTVIATWNKIGVTTTTDSMEPREAEDLDFLSAKTIFYRGFAIPVYDRTKLMTSLLYSETKSQSPAYTLLRAAALLQVGWSDVQFRRFCRDFIEWLFHNFDDILASDEDWQMAKCAILSDQRLEKLFVGVELYPQSYLEHEERLQSQIKAMSVVIQTKQKSRSRRGKGAKATRQIKKKNQPGVVLRQQPQRKRRGGRVGRKSNSKNGIFNSRQLTGKGSTRNQTTNRRGVVVEEDEFIQAVTVANQPNFNAVQLSVNIGQSGTFPWGNTVAKNYQKYQFDYLEFYYKREVSEFATNGQVGKVMMFFNPDASDGAPTTKQQIEDSECHADAMPCENFRLVVPPTMLKNMKDAMFIRTGGLVGGTDIKTYDIGNFFIATQGVVNNVEVGELHVRYRCRCFIPVIPGLQAAGANLSSSFFQSTTTQTYTTATPANALVATATTNGLAVVNTAGSMVPPSGNYLVMVSGTYTDATAEAYTVVQDIQKNGTTIFTAALLPGFKTAISTGAGEQCDISSQVWVTANGSDAFTVKVTMTGAAGVLTGATSVLWNAA